MVSPVGQLAPSSKSAILLPTFLLGMDRLRVECGIWGAALKGVGIIEAQLARTYPTSCSQGGWNGECIGMGIEHETIALSELSRTHHILPFLSLKGRAQLKPLS